MNDPVKITCYGTTEVLDRKDAIAKYFEGVLACEGSERDTYADILSALYFGQKEVVV